MLEAGWCKGKMVHKRKAILLFKRNKQELYNHNFSVLVYQLSLWHPKIYPMVHSIRRQSVIGAKNVRKCEARGKDKQFSILRLYCRVQHTFQHGRIQPVRLRGAVSVTFDSQVSLRVHYCKKKEVYFTTLQWHKTDGRQNSVISRMLFFKLYKIMVNNATFVGCRWGGGDHHICPLPMDPAVPSRLVIWMQSWLLQFATHHVIEFQKTNRHVRKKQPMQKRSADPNLSFWWWLLAVTHFSKKHSRSSAWQIARRKLHQDRTLFLCLISWSSVSLLKTKKSQVREEQDKEK